MAPTARGLLLALMTAWLGPAPPTVTDPEVLRGIRHVEEGDYDEAIVVLDAATRRLAASPSPSRDLAHAYVHLGIAFLAKGHESSAKARFREALARAGDLTLSADSYAPKVIEVFETAKMDMERASAPAPAGASPPPTDRKKGGSSKGILIVGAGAALAGGVALAAGGGGGSSAATTQPAASFVLEPGDTQALPPRGGTGGAAFLLACSAGQVAIGITGLSDATFVYRVAPVCAALATSGALSGENVLPFPAGGTGGAGTTFTERCPDGQAIVRVSGTVSTLPNGQTIVSQLGVGCAGVRDWAGGGASVFNLAFHGVPVGQSAPFIDTCPSAYVVTALNGAAAFFLERVTATCTRVRR